MTLRIRRIARDCNDYRLQVEPLEDRRLLATLTVNSLLDNMAAGDDLVTLREAMLAANNDAATDLGEIGSGADTIQFSVAGLMKLESELPTISQAVTIAGDSQITIDAGDGADGKFATGDGFRIFTIDDGDAATTIDVTLRGLTLTGGDTGTDDDGVGLDGGAIFSVENLTLIDAIVMNNAAGDGDATAGGGPWGGSGGGIWSNNGSLTLNGSNVSGNKSGNGGSLSGLGGNGGGIGVGKLSSNALTLIGSTVSGNRTGDGGDGSGGAAGGAQAGIPGNGGGIHIYDGTVMLIESTVSGNSTGAGGFRFDGLRNSGDGGGIFASVDVATTLTRSTVSGNVAGRSGGGIRSLGDVSINESTISGNRVYPQFGGGKGGGISIDRGGIIVSPVNLVISQSTIADNRVIPRGNFSTDSVGGGIYSQDNGTMTITNSIFSRNSAGDSPDIRPGTGDLNVDFSLIEQVGLPIAGTGNIIGTSPNLGPLADNGGPTQTHALLPGSPAIDAGDPGIAVNTSEFDQRGEPFVRVFDGDEANGVRVDIGAYELQPTTSQTCAPLDVNCDGVVSPVDALLVINALGNPAAAQALGMNPNGPVTPLDALLVINQLGTETGVDAISRQAEPVAASVRETALLSLFEEEGFGKDDDPLTHFLLG